MRKLASAALQQRDVLAIDKMSFEKDKYELVEAEGDWFAVAGIPSLGATTRGQEVGSLFQEINSEGYFFITGFA